MNFRIPMKEIAAEVALSGLDPDRYQLFLAPFSDRHEGSETLDEYLNGNRGFFPMLCEGVAKIVNRDQILWLRLEKRPQDETELTVVQKLTIVELIDGSRLEGYIWIDRPAEQQRVSDLLNDPHEFFVRLDDEESTHYVNKKFIRSVIPR
jgi:hypothetical protein